MAKFRATFAEAVTQIDHKDAYSLMNRAQVQHDVAISEFRRLVDPKRIQNFDAAVEKFK